MHTGIVMCTHEIEFEKASTTVFMIGPKDGIETFYLFISFVSFPRKFSIYLFFHFFFFFFFFDTEIIYNHSVQ